MKMKTYVYSIGGLVALLIVLLMSYSDSTFTFRSRAHNEPRNQTISSGSIEVQNVKPDELGTCLKNVSYLPSRQDSQSTCFVQYSCENMSAIQPQLPEICSIEDERLTCESQTCQPVSYWLEEARRYCNCAN